MTTGVGSSCATGAEVCSGVWFSVFAGLGGCSDMLARPSTGKGGVFTGGEGTGSLDVSVVRGFSVGGGFETSGGVEWEAS